MSVEAVAELIHMPSQDCPTPKSAQVQLRQWFAKNQMGSVTSRQLALFSVGANTQHLKIAEQSALKYFIIRAYPAFS